MTGLLRYKLARSWNAHSRKLIPGILVVMLAGVLFPFITTDPGSEPENNYSNNILTNSDTFAYGNALSAEDYANVENTVSRDRDALNRSDKSAAAAAGLLPFMAPLYSKLSPDAVLANGSRSQLYNMINSQPGVTFGTLARTLNIAPGTAEYHLRILEREGYIRARKCGKFVMYYPWEMSTSPYTPVQQKIVNSLAIEPGMSQTTLAEKVGVSKQVVNYNIKQLRELGVLKEQRVGTKILSQINAESLNETPAV